MNLIYLLFAFLTGLAITVQAGINANLRQAMGNPVLAASISFGTGFMTLLLILIASGGRGAAGRHYSAGKLVEVDRRPDWSNLCNNGYYQCPKNWYG